VCVNLFPRNYKDYICKLGVVNDLSHVLYQAIHCFVVDLVLFKLPDIKYADVIQPLAPIEASKDEELLCTDHTCSVSLPSSWSLFTFYRVTPSHGIGIQYIKVIAWNDLLERTTSAIVSSEKVNLVTNQVSCMPT